MNILNFGKKQQIKQPFIEKHIGLLSFMKESVANKLPNVALDEDVYQAYVEKNGTRFSIACDAFGYQISALVDNRYERIGQFEALASTETWDKTNTLYEVANEVLNTLCASKKQQKIS